MTVKNDFCGNTLEEQAVCALKDKKLTVATAESCTGGMVASKLVNVKGASQVFHQGYITYCDEAKHTMLGVSEDTLKKYFAVSSQTACEMAEGGARAAGADVCVSVTGVAGPDTEDGKPVGCVYIGCCYRGNTQVREFNFEGDRMSVRCQAADEALRFIIDTVALSDGNRPQSEYKKEKSGI